jgi:hypothetical protein
MKVMPDILSNAAPGRVSCLTDWMATMFSSTWMISVPDSQMRSTQQQRKTADVVDVCTRWRVWTEYLTVECSSLIEIHGRLIGMW